MSTERDTLYYWLLLTFSLLSLFLLTRPYISWSDAPTGLVSLLTLVSVCSTGVSPTLICSSLELVVMVSCLLWCQAPLNLRNLTTPDTSQHTSSRHTNNQSCVVKKCTESWDFLEHSLQRLLESLSIVLYFPPEPYKLPLISREECDRPIIISVSGCSD